jgi:hypothetical protein
MPEHAPESELTTVHGRLSVRPFAHLLVLATHEQWSGTLVIEHEEAIGSDDDRVIFLAGDPVAVRLAGGSFGAFEPELLRLCDRRGAYVFVHGQVLVSRTEGSIRGSADGLALVAMAARRGGRPDAIEAILKKLGDHTPVRLSPEAPLDRLRLTGEEREVVELVRSRGLASVTDLLREARVPADVVLRTVYVLVVTRMAVPVRDRSSRPSWSSVPPVSSGVHQVQEAAEPLDATPAASVDPVAEALSEARTFMDMRDFAGAASVLRAAVDATPGVAELHIELAKALYHAHSGAGAPLHDMLQAVNMALALDHRSAQAHYTKGLIAKRMGRTEQAVLHFRRALSLDRRHLDAARELHLAEMRQGDGFLGRLRRLL